MWRSVDTPYQCPPIRGDVEEHQYSVSVRAKICDIPAIRIIMISLQRYVKQLLPFIPHHRQKSTMTYNIIFAAVLKLLLSFLVSSVLLFSNWHGNVSPQLDQAISLPANLKEPANSEMPKAGPETAAATTSVKNRADRILKHSLWFIEETIAEGECRDTGHHQVLVIDVPRPEGWAFASLSILCPPCLSDAQPWRGSEPVVLFMLIGGTTVRSIPRPDASMVDERKRRRWFRLRYHYANRADPGWYRSGRSGGIGATASSIVAFQRAQSPRCVAGFPVNRLTRQASPFRSIVATWTESSRAANNGMRRSF
jgi:hypothetical protein